MGGVMFVVDQLKLLFLFGVGLGCGFDLGGNVGGLY